MFGHISYCDSLKYDTSTSSHLPCGGNEQAQTIDGNIDGDAHACKSQVALSHDGL